MLSDGTYTLAKVDSVPLKSGCGRINREFKVNSVFLRYLDLHQPAE